VNFLLSIAGGAFVAIFLLGTAIAIEQLGPVERYSLRDRVPGLTMNIVSSILTVGLIWPLGWLWREIGIAPAIVVPLWQWLEPLGNSGFAIQVVVLVALPTSWPIGAIGLSMRGSGACTWFTMPRVNCMRRTASVTPCRLSSASRSSPFR
jgi:hypothetical protein